MARNRLRNHDLLKENCWYFLYRKGLVVLQTPPNRNSDCMYHLPEHSKTVNLAGRLYVSHVFPTII
jgi:hypothetical protein